MLTAPKRAAEISPIRVPRMRQKANSTVAAVDGTPCQTGMIAQDGIERELILTNKRTSAIVPVPIRAKQKACSPEFVGEFWLREVSELVI